ncbi:MAG: hypothetical protein JNM29_02195 [Candidatus Odyssella sp.]|nr:hypothetical protein [Candidatus Odyssella sp.]
MPYQPDRLRPTLAADNEALIAAPLPGAATGFQLAEARIEPISVPRPQAYDTVTIGVVTGRPLRLEFAVGEVKTREVVRDDLVLGFENGGKVVLKDYMHAFGLLGDQRTTIIQPDGKHYAFTELLAPTAEAKPGTPAAPPGVAVVEKPAAGVTQHVRLAADKPTALGFDKSVVAEARVSREGDLVITFKDRAVLVLEGYAALKASADFALYDWKGDKVAPGAGPDGAGPESGHSFAPFDPGSGPAARDHLGALSSEPARHETPPEQPQSARAKPPSPPAFALPPEHDTPDDVRGARDDGGEARDDAARAAARTAGAAPAEGAAGGLVSIVGAGIEIGGDVAAASGNGPASGAPPPALDAASAQRGWIEGHDSGPAPTAFAAAAIVPDRGNPEAPAIVAAGETAGGTEAGATAPMTPQEIFDSGESAPAPARADAGTGIAAAAPDFGAAAAHAESHALPIQNPAQHNVMGHG